MSTHTLSSERIDRLNGLRQKMKSAGVHAYLIPGTDPHKSEYISNHWKGRDWLSGFTGSAGILAITHHEGRLLTDSRYFLQGASQLKGSGIELLKAKVQGAPEYIDWLAEVLEKGNKVGINGQVFSVVEVERMKKAFGKHGIEIKNVGDLLEGIWESRPEIPNKQAFDHDVKFTGASRTQKLTQIRGKMKKEGFDYHLITALDDIAWTFNLRGSDVKFNPVVTSFALVGASAATLFVDSEKLPKELQGTLRDEGIKLAPYAGISDVLGKLPEGTSLLFDATNTNQELYESFAPGVVAKRGSSLPMAMKAIKNKTEIANFRKVMEKDGVALVRFFMWLEKSVGSVEVTELSAMDKLHDFRAEQEGFVGESFNTISGYKGHGAIIHYGATPETDVPLQPDGLFLLDSGGQYINGTTDITRTTTLGNPTDEEKSDFTLVLKGHIALSRLKFPYGTSGGQMDVLARQAMWAEGINFLHGTGHGVGFFLNVHEGPQRIGTGHGSGFNAAMEVGMVTSNEPGIYREGKHGIRTENLILTTEFKDTEFGRFLQFENLTWCPIDTRLINKSMMSEIEISWLNEYHQEVYTILSPHLNENENSWLKQKTESI